MLFDLQDKTQSFNQIAYTTAFAIKWKIIELERDDYSFMTILTYKLNFTKNNLVNY